MSHWTVDSSTRIRLLTPEQFRKLPDGTEVISILGERMTKGVDYIDDDTRGGFMAYGLEDPLVEALKEKFS